MPFVEIAPPSGAVPSAPTDAVCLTVRLPPGKPGKNKMLILSFGKDVLKSLGWVGEGCCLIALGDGPDKGKVRVTRTAPGAGGFRLRIAKGNGSGRLWFPMPKEKLAQAYTVAMLKLQAEVIRPTENREGAGVCFLWLPKGLVL